MRTRAGPALHAQTFSAGGRTARQRPSDRGRRSLRIPARDAMSDNKEYKLVRSTFQSLREDA
jgi:hypothetical protein